VDTTSAITSATPSRTAFSTAPSSRVTCAEMPASARWRCTRPGYAVAMRRPARSARLRTVPGRAAYRKVDAPKSSPITSSAAGPGGGPAGGRAESEPPHLSCRRSGVDQQVSSGDAQIEVAGADVGGDVAGTEVEELHPGVGIDAGQVFVAGPLPIAGFLQHLGRGPGQGALVGDGDPQHDVLLGLTTASLQDMTGRDQDDLASWRA